MSVFDLLRRAIQGHHSGNPRAEEAYRFATGLAGRVIMSANASSCSHHQKIAVLRKNSHHRKMQKPVLDFVINALQKIRESTDVRPRASRSAIDGFCAQGFASGEGSAPSSSENQLGADSAAPSNSTKVDRLNAVRERVIACRKCEHLACSRTQTVFGVSNPEGEVMFIGEAPGADEDAQGRRCSSAAPDSY